MIRSIGRQWRWLLLIPALLLGGCSMFHFSDLFVGYSQQMNPVRKAIDDNDLSKAQDEIPEQSMSSDSGILREMERARVSFMQGDWKQSRSEFNKVSDRLKWLDEQAKYRLSQGIAQTSSLVTNDQLIPYDVPAYEKALVHHYQALNYLFLGDQSGAMVEIRKADLIQSAILRKHNELLQDSINEAQKTADNWDYFESRYPTPTDGQSQYADAYIFYTSAVLYEASGDLNDAYVDYKHAYAVNPHNRVLQQDLLRVASLMGLRDDVNYYEKRFGFKPKLPPRGTGQLVLISEQGQVPMRQSFKLPLPISTSSGYGRLFTLAFPIYPKLEVSLPSVQLDVGDESLSGQPLNQLGPLAYGALKQQLPGLFVREVLRVTAKEQLRKVGAQKGEDVGNVIVNLYNYLSEQADTRSWTTLPAGSAIARISLKPGQHRVRLQVGGESHQVTLPIKSGQTTLLFVSSAGDYQMQHWTVISGET
ncbi:COG3014 family protein [Dongshaea marina]|uniref:COG3014 family protein n=1 Tax=Dongshaea marina TaxID=2047966 RepID=UPI000D3E9723|nr:hypothetical protein [Dongshaea marina]